MFIQKFLTICAAVLLSLLLTQPAQTQNTIDFKRDAIKSAYGCSTLDQMESLLEEMLQNGPLLPDTQVTLIAVKGCMHLRSRDGKNVNVLIRKVRDSSEGFSIFEIRIPVQVKVFKTFFIFKMSGKVT